MVVQAAIPIITAVGEFTTPYLLRKAGEIGLTRFIQVYGSAAATAIGIQKTQPVDLQTEKILGMPVSHITGQGEVYDDIDYSAIDEDREVEPLKYIDTVHGGKGPLEPIKAKPFPAETEVKKWDESFKAPEPIETTKGLEIPPQEIKIPPGFETPKTVDTSILTQDKPKDITKQTEELVSGTEEDFTEGLKKYEEVYSPERFKKANDEYPELSPANNKKIVEADKHFGARALAREYGHNTGETQLIYLSPQEYLDLTKQFGRIDGTWSPGGKAIIKYLEGKIKDGKEIGEIPILSVSKQGENYLVNGQEGRHRAQAFKNQGYNKIPVRIEGSGKNKESGVENKVYTATPKSYLYKEDWTQKYLNFIPKNIISKSDYNKDTEQYESWESKSVKPGDFYDVASKKKLFVENDITKQTEELVKKELSVSQQTDDLVTKTKTKTKHYKGELTATDTLNSDLMDALVSFTGTPEDIAKSSKLPQSHKKKIFWSLEKYIPKHYPSKLNKAESHHESEALFYITSAIYDAYTNNGKVPDDIILIEDDKGVPMGAAEIEIYPKGKINYYPKRKTKRMVKTEPAIYIEGIGSFNRKTTDLLLEKIELLAEAEGIRYIVGEDLTSEGALKTLSLRGFKPGKKGFFEGEVINEAMWRGGKKGIKAKNMVLDLGEKYATTQEEINKEFEKERIQEQTEKLTSKITLEKVKSDVKFKPSKYANTTDVYYKGKKYAEIEKRPDKEKYKGLSDYDLKYPSGTFSEDGEEILTTEDGAKDALIQGIYNNLKRKK